MNRLASVVLLACGLVASPARAQEAPSVVVSLKPIHSLVAGVMQGVGEPHLLVEGAASAHTYSLRPSNARALSQADLVFWVGPGMENFLVGPLASLASGADSVALAEAHGLELHPYREGGPWEAHTDGDEAEHAHAGQTHDHDGHAGEEVGHEAHANEGRGHEDHADEAAHGAQDHTAHHHAGDDMHVWLDPRNARAMVDAITAALVAADPANEAAYRDNGEALAADLDTLDSDLAERLAPVHEQPFIVFHDAYQYLERRYDLHAAGSITVSPERQPGAERLGAIRDRIAEDGITCVFAEPQFEPRLVETVIEGTEAHAATLDPHGAGFEAGPDLYFELMHGLADSLAACLSESS